MNVLALSFLAGCAGALVVLAAYAITRAHQIRRDRIARRLQGRGFR